MSGYSVLGQKKPKNKDLIVPTFPFSNLLMLFLQLTSCRSPVSPWSPIRFRKTDASVPLPPTVPVQTVTLYLITTEKINHQWSFIHFSVYGIAGFGWSWLWLNAYVWTYRAAAQRSVLRWQKAPSPLHYRLRWCPATAHMEMCISPLLKTSL